MESLDNLNLLGPFGHMNQNPFFLIQDLRIINPVIIKDKFISLLILKIKISLIKCKKKIKSLNLIQVFTKLGNLQKTTQFIITISCSKLICKDFTDVGLFFNDPKSYSDFTIKTNNVINYDFRKNKNF